MTTTRGQVWDKIWEQIKDLPSFKTTSQVLKDIDKINSADAPALFMSLENSFNINRKNVPSQKKMSVTLIIYVTHANTKGRSVAPGKLLIDLIDEVAEVFESNHDMTTSSTCNIDCCSPTQTLGGLVSHCWIEDMVTDENVAGNYAIGAINLDILI